VVLRERVSEIDLEAGVARAESGRTFSFDKLALTTGARVLRLPVPGADLSGVLYLRGLEDADRLAARLPAATRVVVIGGGFIGLEAAAVCRKLGKDVTVVEMAPRLVARAVAPVVSEFYAWAHRQRGTTVLLGQSVTGVEGQDGVVTGVRLDDGTLLEADLVLVGIGVRARGELAEQMGQDTERLQAAVTRRTDAEAALAAEEKALVTARRAIADRREGLATLTRPGGAPRAREDGQARGVG